MANNSTTYAAKPDLRSWLVWTATSTSEFDKKPAGSKYYGVTMLKTPTCNKIRMIKSALRAVRARPVLTAGPIQIVSVHESRKQAFAYRNVLLAKDPNSLNKFSKSDCDHPARHTPPSKISKAVRRRVSEEKEMAAWDELIGKMSPADRESLNERAEVWVTVPEVTRESPSTKTDYNPSFIQKTFSRFTGWLEDLFEPITDMVFWY